MNEDWIELGPSQNLPPVTKKIRGSSVTVYVSPHSVPRAVRGRRDRELGTFHIDFRYLDGQDGSLHASQQSHDGAVTVMTGRSSGRIERIDVKLTPSTNDISLRIIVDKAEQILSVVENSGQSLSLRLNAKAAYSAVEDSWQALSSAMA